MFSLTNSMQYYLYGHYSDMRKSFDSFCGIIQSRMKRDPMSGEVFIFVNRRKDRLKLLRWEQGGFILYYKRLECGTLELPKSEQNITSQSIGWTQLVMMIQGLSFEKLRIKKRYPVHKVVDKKTA